MLRPLLPVLLIAACSSSAGSQPRIVEQPAPSRVSRAHRDPPPRADAPSAEMRGLLAAHDAARAKHCAPPLTWSPALAQVAQKWADHLRDAGCAFEHSRTDYGENLAAGTDGALDADGVVAMWYGEIAKYDFRRGGFSMETGHFTQLVWKGTTQLGCGTSRCNGMTIWVCNYDPAGNVEGEYRENVSPTGCH
jgi:pathogenesis-related protein 1